MGCGASSTANSPTIDACEQVKELETIPDLSAIADIHESLANENEDTTKIQKALFPLPSDKLLEIDKSYRNKHGHSLADSPLLKKYPLWSMLFCENLPEQRLRKFFTQGSGDVLLLIDIIMSLKDEQSPLGVFNEEIVRTLSSKFASEKDILHLFKCSAGERTQSVQLSDGKVIDISNPTTYLVTRLHHHITENNNTDALFILLMRRQVDLGEIANNFKSNYTKSLWDEFSESYPHVQLLDLSPVSKPSDDCSQSYEFERVQSEIIDNLSNTATENGAVESPLDDVPLVKPKMSQPARVSFQVTPKEPSPQKPPKRSKPTKISFQEVLKDPSLESPVKEDATSTPAVVTVATQHSGPVAPLASTRATTPASTRVTTPASVTETNPVKNTPSVTNDELVKVPTINVIVDVSNCKPANFHEDLELHEETQITDKKMEIEISFEDHLKELHDALSESRTIIEKISNTLVNVLHHDNRDIEKIYSETYSKNLMETLKEKLNEDAFKTAEYLILRYLKASALLLDQAITENDHSTVDQVLMVLLCSTTQQVRDIVREFPSLTQRRSLNEVLTENLLGEFQRFVGALLKGDRDEKSSIDENVAKSDANRLHKATDFRWDGEDNIFNEVFIKRNMEQLKLTFSFFEDESGSDITELILQEFTFHLQKALLNLVYIVNNGLTKFLAKFVFESKSKSHFTSVLFWVISARFKVDLKEVSEEYNRKYGTSLTDLIDSANLSGDCRTLLRALCDSLG